MGRKQLIAFKESDYLSSVQIQRRQLRSQLFNRHYCPSGELQQHMYVMK